MADENGIILYHYPFSVFGKRITWYLALRGLQYSEVIVPNRMPRPELAAVGVKYRRIPVCAIGKDIYCDTRLIIPKLESLSRDKAPPLGAQTPYEQGIEYLLENWSCDGGPFWRVASTLPTDLPGFTDNPEWVRDREDMTGHKYDRQALKERRAESFVQIRIHLDFLEGKLLADGRKWVLGGESPGLADIHAIWPFDWLMLPVMRSTHPPGLITKQQYPLVLAYIERFNAALSFARFSRPSSIALSWSEASQRILDAGCFDTTTGIDTLDPLGLRAGQEVELFPTDSGMNCKDQGRLHAVTSDEVVINAEAPNRGLVRIHYPRINVRVQPIAGGAKM